jgi:hypothetical protein
MPSPSRLLASPISRPLLRPFVRRVAAIVLLGAAALAGAEETDTLLESLCWRADQLRRAKAEAVESPLAKAKVRCGAWHRIGPFKDAEYGVLAREFDAAFAPESDVIARGNRAAEL